MAIYMAIYKSEIQRRFALFNEGVSAGLVLGIGLGGFIDGIVLDQILQWHTTGSAILSPTSVDAMSKNMRWDGLFGFVMFVVTLVGVMMLHREGRDGITPTLKCFIGEMLFGWGLANLIEGLIAHHLLQLHHVRDLPAPVPLYDWLYLGVDGGLVLVGWMLSRKNRHY